MKKESRERELIVYMLVEILNSPDTVGLKDKPKVIFMVENLFLELNVFLGENVPCHSLLCLSRGPIA